jgi:signal transduction histidine kinase
MDWTKSSHQGSSSAKSFTFFGLVLFLLIAIGLTGYRVTVAGVNSRLWMIHTFQVQAAIQSLRLNLFQASAARRNYVLFDDAVYLQNFDDAASRCIKSLHLIRTLTADNPLQQRRLDQAEVLVQERLGLLRDSIERHRRTHQSSGQQIDVDLDEARLTQQTGDLLQTMFDAESQLLASRQLTSSRMFQATVVVLILSFIFAVGLLASNFLLLNAELKRRRVTEETLRAVGESYRRLSSRVLELQDQERRRLGRALHDSAGQYLASVKMSLAHLRKNTGDAETLKLLTDALQYVDRTISEIRTVSHLLHPPLLDEVGFVPASRWYVEEFATRSGIQVHLELPADAERLPGDMELVLFRVLQEGLTNVHRHSGAHKVDIIFVRSSETVELTLADDGTGMSQQALDRFRSGIGLGVGLAGMRERVAELGGTMTVESSEAGTALKVTLPAAPNPEPAGAVSAA